MTIERVLLTGATGFLGRAVLAPLVARGVEVHAVAHRSPPAPRPGVVWHRADLLDPGSARRLVEAVRPDTLVHAAWHVEHGRFWTAPENTAWLEASTALAHYAAEAGARRILGIGTCAEYADTAPGDAAPWPESRAIDPATPYGAAKAALAGRLAALAESRAGLDWAWARIFLLFGPGEAPARLVPSVMLALLDGEAASCGSGRAVRDIASTWHVGAALAAVARSRLRGPVNVASGEGHALGAVAEMIGALAGRPELVRLGALPDRPGEVPSMVADVRRLRAVHPAPPALRDELARMLTWQRQERLRRA